MKVTFFLILQVVGSFLWLYCNLVMPSAQEVIGRWRSFLAPTVERDQTDGFHVLCFVFV